MPTRTLDPVHLAARDLATTPVHPDGHGRCGRCGQVGDAIAIGEVVSTNFTGWDALDRDAACLCPDCAWSYRDPSLRTAPVLLDTGRATRPGWPVLAARLARPLGPDAAATVPVAGRKHLLPSLAWGSVATDTGVLVWDAPAADLVAAVADLRAAGATDRVLRNGSSPAAAIAGSAEPDRLLAAWLLLRTWTGTPHLAVALHLTRPRTRSQP